MKRIYGSLGSAALGMMAMSIVDDPLYKTKKPVDAEDDATEKQDDEASLSGDEASAERNDGLPPIRHEPRVIKIVPPAHYDDDVFMGQDFYGKEPKAPRYSPHQGNREVARRLKRMQKKANS